MKVCEQCNKEHDGSYGSGRFCSETCKAKYISSKVKHHVCNFKSKKIAKGNWKCPHCEFIASTRAKLKEHQHQNHPQFCVEGGWNKGLTKETNNIIRKHSETLFNNYKSGKIKSFWKGRHHSEETRKHMSLVCGGKRDHSGRGKQGWYKGIWCDSSWELAWVIFNLEHNIKFKRYGGYFSYVFEGKTYKYYPDFELEDGTIVEIKGFKNKFWNAKLQQFPKDKQLVILSKTEIKPYLDYVISKYGNNFVSLYE